ncbi:MAG TPA: aminotransferase class I/II-fold pyridoxal phosphate-dependent enzyme, partial [Syntrophales bacterium]|nr:aminotransferase class I/II-fold pyridoxal phosphate-dependent enzyme [Syntrophales bacterium]
MDFKRLMAERTKGLSPSPIRKLVPLMRLPGMVSLGGGYPNARTFAFEAMEVVFKSGRRLTIRDNAMDLACQYGPTDAHAELKPHLVAWHRAKDGVELKPEQIQVLTGAQEGLHIMAYLFLDRSDAVVLSEPAYPGALGAFRAFTENFIPVPIDAEGMKTIDLEKILDARRKAGQAMPKFIYEVP